MTGFGLDLEAVGFGFHWFGCSIGLGSLGKQLGWMRRGLETRTCWDSTLIGMFAHLDTPASFDLDYSYILDFVARPFAILVTWFGHSRISVVFPMLKPSNRMQGERAEGPFRRGLAWHDEPPAGC